MSVNCIFNKGGKLHLSAGSYISKDICNRNKLCNIITKFIIAPETKITILDRDGKEVYERSNKQWVKEYNLVWITLDKYTTIIVSKISDDCPWDYIIVGLGSAGSILARKLSDDCSSRVLVIESGINHQDDPNVLDPNWLPHATDFLYNPKYSSTYPYPPSAINPFAGFPYSEGRGWGGSSMHNFLVAVRGTPRIYDLWASISGNSDWSYNEMLPLMKALETYTPNGTIPDLIQRGTMGPISVTQSAPLPPNPILTAYSTVMSAPFVSDYNDPPFGNIGISANQEFITPPPNSRRSYANLEFLPVGKIVNKFGYGLHGRKLKIISNAQTLSFDVSKDGRAKSVKYVYTGKTDEILSAKLDRKGSLILSAGSINTPKILMSSGIGPAEELESLGIRVKVDSPQVGKNLQCQYGTTIIMTGSIPNFSHAYVNASPYMPNDDIRRIQIFNIAIAPQLLQALPALLNPKSRGSVTLTDPNPLVQPKLNIGVYNDPQGIGSDTYLGIAFFKLMKQVSIDTGEFLIFPPPDHFPAPYGPAPDDSLLIGDLLNLNNLVIQSHIVGTTRMSDDISTGVVDGELKVFGLKNVRIADAGIEPETVDGNTCFSAYYIALVMAKLLGVNTPPAL